MNKIYVCSDLHGMYDLWAQIRDYADETDQIIFLGDAMDRGPDGWKMFKEIYKDPRVTYLKGNHEDMLWKAIRSHDYFCDNGWYRDDSLQLYISNGGEPTWDACQSDENLGDWYGILRDLPEEKCIDLNGIHFVLTHSGYDPEEDSVIRDCIWNRYHCLQEWPEDPNYENIVMIHGHTIIFYHSFTDIVEEVNIDDLQPLMYANGHKIDIDLGSVVSGKAALFDLTTSAQTCEPTSIIFSTKPIYNN